MAIADLKRDKDDDNGDKIVLIYGFKPPEYAVYRTADRVVIKYADDPDLNQSQRKAMVDLNPLRGEINGLIDGWRANRTLLQNIGAIWNTLRGRKPVVDLRPSPLRRKAERYDRRVADALIFGFENDVASAQGLLAKIKQDLLDERVAQARFEYLIAAFLTALTSVVLVLWLSPQLNGGARDLLLAASAGTVGAFFSIALAIRGRTVLPDLQRVNNIMDAMLRIMIGLIAAAVLISLMRSGAVKLEIGSASLREAFCTGDGMACAFTKDWTYVLLLGFIAGFSERFVPDLLQKVSDTAGGKAADATAAATAAAIAQGQGPASPGSAPADPTPPPKSPDGAAASDQQEADDGDAHDDHCVSEVELNEAELTPDTDLPAAAGGVARPETGGQS